MWEDNLCIYLYDESGTPIGMRYRKNSYEADRFDTFWYTKNLQGDIVGVFNEEGVLVRSYVYDAWGVVRATIHNNTGTNSNARFNPFFYRGYYYDAQLGLYYLNSRYYDPQTCRFINADEYVSTGQGLNGHNMFAYCGNNPVSRADSTGKFWITALVVTTVAVACAFALTGCSKKVDVGAAPDYKEIGSSDGDRSTNPNCYTYAIGEYKKAYNPGSISNKTFTYDVESVASAVEADLSALNRGCRRIDSYDSPIDNTEYRIALRVSTPTLKIIPYYGMCIDWDYHFMVQTSSGGWAEKHGAGGATVYHKNGNPNTISWDCGNIKGYYDSDIIYFAITN